MNDRKDDRKQILIRLTPEQVSLIDAVAKKLGISRNFWVTQVVEEAIADLRLDAILGYWQVEGGIATPSDDCPRCEQPMDGGVFVGMTQVGRIIGPLCARCAGQK